MMLHFTTSENMSMIWVAHDITKHAVERFENRVHLRGTYMELLDAPIPGVPCTTFLFVITNSPR